MPQKSPERVRTHVVYDKTNGKVVGHYRHYHLGSETFTECESDAVIDLFRQDENILREVTDRDPQNLAVLCSDVPLASDRTAQYVDPKGRRLLELPRLRLRAERDRLSGDGKEYIEISVDVVNRLGQIERDFSAPLLITTTRGKLSLPGGRMDLKGGTGKFRLTSTAETVEKVRVRARALNEMAASDQLFIQFD